MLSVRVVGTELLPVPAEGNYWQEPACRQLSVIIMRVIPGGASAQTRNPVFSGVRIPDLDPLGLNDALLNPDLIWEKFSDIDCISFRLFLLLPLLKFILFVATSLVVFLGNS